MNSPVEDRLREALGEAGAMLDVGALRPLAAPDRRRFRVDMRLAAAAAAVVVAGAATVVGVTGVTGSGSQDGMTRAASQPTTPDQVDVSVFLCTGREPDKKACQGHAVTEEQKTTLAESLRRIPEVTSVRFEDRRAAYERFRKAFADYPGILGKVTSDELPESYHITVNRDRQRPVSEAAQEMPGVALVSNPAMAGVEGYSAASLRDLADLTAFLCNTSSVQPACDRYAASKTSKRGRAITATDLTKLQEQLRAMPEVRKVHFEDQGEAYAKFKKSYSANKAMLSAVKVEDMPMSFRIFLRPGADAAKVGAKVRSRPGVAQVIEMRCVVLPAILLGDHGLERKDVCR
ncbi:permease-like cell division protein FtsX [Nonomuraea sp. NPDC050691]|uniref:permease-like cell division protein FtsX n=1 Tax=Nonomuraea sp. NPDC050691 TaxID=3155661 RepID=UPI0033C15ED0